MSQLTNYLALPSVKYSADGKFLYCLMRHDSAAAATELWRMDLASGKVAPVLRGVSMEEYDISLDSKKVVYSSLGGHPKPANEGHLKSGQRK